MDEIKHKARDLLASCLDDYGCHIEAENVRACEDLDSYEIELRLIETLLRSRTQSAWLKKPAGSRLS